MATNWKNIGRLGHANRVLGDDDANNDFASTTVVANRDGSVLERQEFSFDEYLSLHRCVAKTDGAVTVAADPLFTISGGPVRVRIFGIVTTTLEASASACKLTITTTSPAATVDMGTSVEMNGKAAGTSIRHINTTAVLTPVTAGFVMMGSAFATEDTQFFCPAGTINFIGVAALTGVIAWYCEYTPLSPLSRVVAAA